jgi:metal-dependent amidase/aminoacylase/carboxypeptidase family protein
MGALPIHDANELPYRSEHQGIIHACGRGGHTTMLPGAARYLAETHSALLSPQAAWRILVLPTIGGDQNAEL